MTNADDQIENLYYRLRRAQRWIAIFKSYENRYPWYRLASLMAGSLLVFVTFQSLSFLAGWVSIMLALAGFGLVAHYHNRLIERIARLTGFVRFLTAQIARIELDWDNIPAATPIEMSQDHPFSYDLGITGEKSLHQLIDTCVSIEGSQLLARWLTQSEPNQKAALNRQSLVQELIPLSGFRTRLLLDAQKQPNPMSNRWETGVLINWINNKIRVNSLRPFLLTLLGLSLANIVLFLLNVFNIIPPIWVLTMVVFMGLQSLKYHQTTEVFEDAYTLGKQLGKLGDVFSTLESYPYPVNGKLVKLAGSYTRSKNQPSRSLRRISWTISAASLRNNPFLGLFLNLVMPWDMFFAYLIEKIKISLQDLVPEWLNTWYTIEAVSAIANFARLHPDYCFPELLPARTEPILDMVEVGHPLIPGKERITNTFIINHLGDIALISGSNMSGKSTFLRTLGINLALAFAGCPVVASQMRTIPFRLFTSMAISDSLSDGISFFYAEVRRLKRLLLELNTTNENPLFFLIDEIFRGTNNRERELGSRSYTQALLGGNGAGLISTHDLTLVHLADGNKAIFNYHFKEDILDTQMIFNYKIQSGASPTTNALRIMALAGLPVPDDENQ